MAKFRDGQKVRFTKGVQRTSGAAWPGDTGTVYEVTGDTYRIRLSNGDHLADVRENEIEKE